MFYSNLIELNSGATAKFVEKLRKRSVQNFLDVIALTDIANEPTSGYEILRRVQQKFGILVSSGTVYSLLYSLERDGLTKGVWTKRKRVYELTERGKQNIKDVLKVNEEFQHFLENISLLSAT